MHKNGAMVKNIRPLIILDNYKRIITNNFPPPRPPPQKKT